MSPEPQKPDWTMTAVAICGLAFAVRCLHIWQIRAAPFYGMEIGDSLSYADWARDIAAGHWLGDTVFYQSPLYPYLLGVAYSVFGPSKTAVLLLQALAASAACGLLFDAGRRLGCRTVGWLGGLMLACYPPAIFFDGLIQKSSLDTTLICLEIWCFAFWHQRPSARRAWPAGIVLGLLILNRENALVLLPAVAIAMRSRLMTSSIRPAPAAATEQQRISEPASVSASHRPSGMAQAGSDQPACQDPIRAALSHSVRLIDRAIHSWQQWGRHVARLGLGTALILIPVALRNGVVGGSFHLTTSQFGPNFYIGNHASANGMYQPIRQGGGSAKYERDDAVELAEAARGYQLTAAQVSDYWTQRTLQSIRAQPASWARLMIRKLLLLVNAVEITDTDDLHTYAEWSWPLRLLSPVFHFGVLLPLGVAGFLTSPARHTALRFLLLMIVAYALSVWMFYVMGRYRFPLAVMLMLPAAAGVGQLIQMIRRAVSAFRTRQHDGEHAPWRTTVLLATVTLVALISNWPLLDENQMASVTHYNMAVEFDRANQLESAAAEYRRVLQLNPADADAWENLGDVLKRQNDVPAAVEALLAAIRIDPGRPLAHFELGNLYVRQSKTESAIRHYQHTVRLVPDFPPAYFNLGLALHAARQFDRAVPALEQAMRLSPDYASSVLPIAEQLIEENRLDEAAAYLRILSQSPVRNAQLQHHVRQLQSQIQRKSP